ncbi:hypothetical protein [Caudoviricetes sp.]|nr:MAG: hypothetical protein [Podoviridae sp. ct2cs2]UOF77564.1 hypothetical protein [Caudoviricetes sp.]
MAELNVQGLLDKFFLTKQNPAMEAILAPTEAEKAALEQQKTIGTLIGLGTGVLSNWNKGVAPAVLGGFTGASAGRQAPISNLFTQQKNLLEYGDLLNKVKKGTFESQEAELKNAAWVNAINNAPDAASRNQLILNAPEVVKAELASSPRYNKDVQIFSSAIGKPVNLWGAEDYRNFNIYNEKPTSETAAKEEVNRARLAYETGRNIPPMETKEMFLRRITGQPITQPEGQPQGTPTGTPAGKPSTGFKQPPTETKQNIPLIESSAISPKNKEQLLIEQPKATQATEYALNSTRRIRNSVNRILDNPKFREAFGKDGVLLSYIPNSEAASAAAELETLKNQLFVEGITDMRNASQTGAAVGNVTEKEGSRFENFKASLQQKRKFADIVAELERLDTEMETSEKRLSNAYSRTYRPADFVVDKLYTRGSYKAPPSAKDVPLNSPSGGTGSWGIREIK